MKADVSVIVPTTAEAGRAQCLRRALDSILTQAEVNSQALIVINGQRLDREFCADLERRDRIDVHYLEEPNLPAAIHHGRTLVRTPFFSFLDDDDLYLPGCLAQRCQIMLEQPGVDAVVTNGYRQIGEQRIPVLEAFQEIGADPLLSLMRANWLASCAGLFRTDSIGPDFFQSGQKYFEWTMTAFRLALERRLYFLDRFTYCINDTADSLSKSSQSNATAPAFLQRLLAYEAPARIRRELRRKLCRAYHDLAELQRVQGNRGLAWRYHLRSLGNLYGFRYLAYTRRLI